MSTETVLIIIVAAMKVFFIQIALFGAFGCVAGFNGFTELYNTHEEPRLVSDDYKISFALKEKFIAQKLDNFDPNNTKKWDMRYFENDMFHEAGE